MEAIDVKKCINKRVIMRDHGYRPDEDKGKFEMKYSGATTQYTTTIQKLSPSGEWVHVTMLKEAVIDAAQGPSISKPWSSMTIADALEMLNEEKLSMFKVSERHVIALMWICVSDFNDEGMEIIPGELPPKRFSIVEIVS